MRNGTWSRNGSPHPRRVTFGQVAVQKGFASSRNIDEALRIQEHLRTQGSRHKPIGLIMLEMGVFGTTELIEVLQELTAHPSPVAPSSVPSIR